MNLSPQILLVIATLSWAGNFVLGRAIHAEIPPLSLTFWRWVAAFVLFAPFVAGTVWRQRALIRQHIALIFVLSVCGSVMFHSFTYIALNSTTAINASLMLSTMPMVIPVFSSLINRDHLTARQGFGIAVSMAGVGIVLTRLDLDVLLALSFTPGDLWVLGAVVAWSIYSVLLKRVPKDLSPKAMLAVIIAIAVVVLAPLYGWEYGQVGGFAVNATNLAAIAYVAVFASIIAFTCWNGAVAVIGPNKAGLYIHLIPLFSAMLAIALLGETLYGYHLAGITLIVTGIFMTNRAPKELPA